MIPFASEFPIRPIPHPAAFVAQVVSWLRGIKSSTILDDREDTDLDGETALLRSSNGEELRLRQFGHDHTFEAIGFRHDIPDDGDRLWRTEAVLRRGTSGNGQDIIRLRTQCIARGAGARLETPRKPFLIKSMLRDEWGGTDGLLNVSEQPIWLKDDESSLAMASNIMFGGASRHLPVIYISASDNSQWLLSRKEIERLGFDLGGVAHIVVEPGRAFSYRLRDETQGANVYGGTIAIALPRKGIVRRFFIGWQFEDKSKLIQAVKFAAFSIRSQMPAEGWDWTELQEQALRMQRMHEKRRLSAKETEQLLENEIENLKDRIRHLQEQLSSRPVVDSSTSSDAGLFIDPLIERIGPEVYPGEFSDRLRLAIKLAIQQADQIGLDTRSKAVFNSIIKHLPVSPALFELQEDLRRATKDPKRMASELSSLLQRHGYRQKSDNKHLKMEAKDGYVGLGTIIMAKTLGEGRGLQNNRKQIESTLGITKLTD